MRKVLLASAAILGATGSLAVASQRPSQIDRCGPQSAASAEQPSVLHSTRYLLTNGSHPQLWTNCRGPTSRAR